MDFKITELWERFLRDSEQPFSDETFNLYIDWCEQIEKQLPIADILEISTK